MRQSSGLIVRQVSVSSARQQIPGPARQVSVKASLPTPQADTASSLTAGEQQSDTSISAVTIITAAEGQGAAVSAESSMIATPVKSAPVTKFAGHSANDGGNDLQGFMQVVAAQAAYELEAREKDENAEREEPTSGTVEAAPAAYPASVACSSASSVALPSAAAGKPPGTCKGTWERESRSLPLAQAPAVIMGASKAASITHQQEPLPRAPIASPLQLNTTGVRSAWR